MKNQILSEFQKYLRSKSLVSDKYIPFYANWASKFLSFSSENKNLSHELKVEELPELSEITGEHFRLAGKARQAMLFKYM